jgi:hypothetical protein
LNVLVLPNRHASVEEVGRGFFAAAAFANYLEKKPRLYAVTGWVNLPEQGRVNLSERHSS